MWNENENMPKLCNSHRYQGRYGTCHLSGSSSKVKDRDRSRSPFKNSATNTKALSNSGGQDNTLGFREQNLQLKKKCDDLRRRHRKEREAWIKEKDGLLKEVTELKAGENRGNLLELKAVLEVIQTEQRREEKKWTDFLLQFLNDRCGWEIERIELKQYISKLEDPSTKTCANQGTPNNPGAAQTQKSEQEQLLEDKTAAVMELRTQLENNDRNWKMEKMEMLERFDTERKEWECQWKMMQRKIEELYQEVRLRREKNLNGAEDRLEEKRLPFSIPFSPDEPTKTANVERQNDVVCMKSDRSDRIWLNDYPHAKIEKAEIKIPSQNRHVSSAESEKSIAQRMSKTENDTLNDALKEIARVSEELCKYQEEIQTRTICKKAVSDSAVGESRRNLHVKTPRNPAPCPRASPNKQKDFVSSKIVSSFTAEQSQLKKKDEGSLETQDTSFPSLNFSWPLSNSLFQDKIPVINENLVPIKSEKVSTDIELLNNDGDLCHLEWLCGIGTLEDGDFTESLFNSFTDINHFTPEMNKQNLSMSQNHFFNSDGLYPEVIMLGHSTVGSAYSYGNTIKNGKLAAKIDEFNRVVFKAGKGNAISHDDMPRDLALDIDEEYFSPPVSQHLTTGKTITKPLTVPEIREPPCTISTSYNGGKVEKPRVQQHQQTNGPLTTSSYKNTLQQHNWKGINLSGRPRSADSRSNYGVVEKLLKSYETKVTAPVCHSKPSVSKWTQSDFLLTDNCSDTLTQYLEMLHLEQTANVLQNDIHWYPHQDSSNLRLPEVSRTSSSDKGFSRPARPANRRPPSRWASARSPSVPAPTRRATH
ncbi:microtubule cross-linking factor 3 isoform X2 [Anomaloglossus baeobatrachus]|uniref:microtubule cross-linking factor 3 isoform X2 n=2 Tax=Anomaloglossus baeobatrachus TaxID=238106 RepID=UPI003F506171